MNQDLPVQVDPMEEKGTITYATEVIATIVGVATTEVEGISSMSGAASISELLSGRSKNLSRGVKVEVGAEEVAVDVSVIVDYGMPIQTVGRNVQENIRKSIETMTGLHVIKVDVHVLGVSFEKENKELEQGQEVARLQSGEAQEAFGGFLPDREAADRPAIAEEKATIVQQDKADAPDPTDPVAEAPRKRGRPSKRNPSPQAEDLPFPSETADSEIADQRPEDAGEAEDAGDPGIADDAIDVSAQAKETEEEKEKQEKKPKKRDRPAKRKDAPETSEA